MTALFREVLAMSLSAGFLVVIILGFRLCFRRVPKWVQCALWALVAVRLLVPSLPQSRLSMVPEPVSDREMIAEMVADMPPILPAQPAPVQPAAPTPEAPLPAPVPVPEIRPAPAPVPWMSILPWVWLAGIAAMGLYAFFSTRRVLKQVGPSVHIGNGIWLCDYIDTPFLLGLRRPRIYLPSYLDRETADYVLAHERSHIRRRDHWWKPIGFLLLSIHWFNPMIWLGYCLLCRDIEMACDEAVIRSMSSRAKQEYSVALLQCSLPRRTIAICPLAFGEVGVRERIKTVLHYKKPALWLTLIGVAALVLGAVFFLTDPQKGHRELEYFPTAQYNAATDELTTWEYDDDFRVIREIEYKHGREDFRREYSYKRRGRTLTRTVVCTKGTNDHTSVNCDGVMIAPGESVTFVHEETLDENDNVLQSVCHANGTWLSTHTYTYDGNGSILTQIDEECEADDPTQERFTRTTTNTYDARGNQASREWILESDAMGQISNHKQTYTWNGDDHPVSSQQYLDGKLTVGTHRTYDENGRLVTLTSSDGGTVPTVTHYVREGLKETVTTTREGEGTLSTRLYFYDEQDNVLSAYDLQSKCVLISATNYIGTDGTRSAGIPAEIYTEGRVIFPHPAAYVLKNEQPVYNLPDWAQSDDFIPNPPRRDSGKTEYLQTAFCNPSSEGDRLLLRQYDKNFRVIEESEYQGGRETFHSQYTYQGNDHVLITTETTSNLTTGGNGHHVSRSGDGYIIAPGRTVEVTFYERMDDNGNVLEQITCTGGRITCTKTFTYDQSGNLLASSTGTPDYASRTACAYDAQGHLIQKVSASNFVSPDRDSVSEYRWIYDENGYLIQTDYYQNGRLWWSDLYTNDAQGNMLSCEQRSDPNQSRITAYHRDERQHLTVEDTVQVNGTNARREIRQYDDHDNLLRTISGQDGSITWAVNYLGTDGSRIIGIPREVCDEGYAEVPMPTLNFPPLPYDEDERKDLCLRNWTIFLSNLDYKVNILQTSDIRSPLPAQLKSHFEGRETQAIFFMQDRLILTGDQGFMRRGNIDYERSAGGSWYPRASQTEPEAYRWYAPLLLHRDNLSFLSDETVDGVREVTYRIAPRPGEDRPCGAITYKLLEGGDMAGVRLTEDITVCDGYQVDVRRTTEVTVQSASYDALDWAFMEQEKNIADAPAR